MEHGSSVMGLLAEFRYLVRRFLQFSEEAAVEAGVTPQHHQLQELFGGCEFCFYRLHADRQISDGSHWHEWNSGIYEGESDGWQLIISVVG